MNYIWGAMILIGIIYGTVMGQVEPVSEAVLSSAKEAVTLCITMLGVMALWTGLMEIAKDAGLIRSICDRIRPLIHFLFPKIPKNHPAGEHITMNCVANFLGLGWAATPAGLKAMEALAKLEEERREQEKQDLVKNHRPVEKTETDSWKGKISVPPGTASKEMCTFLIMNISSLQLIPVNVIAYRSQYGSVNPTAIVGPGIVATMASTLAAVVFCKVMERRY